jgi:glyoxylase-like metal-dependent hydrolase (beta-lactamase superfamily II)
VVVIDTQFLPSAAREVIQIAEESSGKEVVAALVLHANPDKFNGTATFQAHGARVITSQQVVDLIPGIHARRTEAFYDRYAPDYPSELPAPESFGAQTMEINAAGLTFKVHVLGAGCSQAHIAVEFEGHLFVGDLVANGTHSWLEIGRTDDWLTRLDELEALGPRFVHPGRGASGGPELLAAERDYLNTVIALVAAEEPAFPFDREVIDRIKANVEAAYPDLRYSVFLSLGLPAEYRRQARMREADAVKEAP